MMRENLTHTIEDYLKVIYEITTTQERASTNQIAAALDVTPASVTGMVKKLADTNPPLLEYQSHRGVILSTEGEKVALEILRHHRLLEMFLHQILGYDWDEVHAEADRLEHFISEEFEERIAQALGNPSHDPHGDPIPDRDLSMPDTPCIELSDLRSNQNARISRVANDDPALLRHLSALGLIPGIEIHVLGYSPYDDNLTLQINPQDPPLVLGPKITRNIFVETIE
jgi:DtxR family Mn-dependent transcriptional regulator